jgi:hypothetical protein
MRNCCFSYLSKDVVQKYKQVSILPKPYQKNKKDKDYIEDKWAFQDTMRIKKC